jgi:hypothetical protein
MREISIIRIVFEKSMVLYAKFNIPNKGDNFIVLIKALVTTNLMPYLQKQQI